MTLRRNDSAAAQLSGPNRRTYHALFRHPAPDDLEWRDVRALLGSMAEVQDGRKGTFKATRRGVMATFRAPRAKEPLSAEELLEVQRFVERSNERVSLPLVAGGLELLVAIDADGARIYRIEVRTRVPRRLDPFHGNGYRAHLRSAHAQLDGESQPMRLSFYKEVARSLKGAERILLLACGGGGGSAMEALRRELERSHAEVSRRVVGALAMKGRRSTEEQLLDKAREFYAGLG